MKAFTNKITAAAASAVLLFTMGSAVYADGSTPASVVQPPRPVEGIRDDGQYHDLVHAGTAQGGYMVYSLDGVTWFTTLPGATATGTYTVYYRAVGDSNHCDSPVGTVTAWITHTDTASFIDHIYVRALGRHVDDATRDSLCALVSQGASGADVVRTIFSGSEFIGKNYSNEQYINIVYQTLFGRDADASGRATWTSALNNGMSRMSMLDEFINSSEFTNLCLVYGLGASTTSEPANTSVAPTTNVRGFVSRLYRTCLGRRPDTNGYEYWSTQLQNRSISGANCAYGFFFSPEFTSAGYSNTEYVTRLYQVFLDRTPDSQGLNNWVAALNSGMSRQDVFYGFAHSAEFTRICADYGIDRG